MIEKSNILVCPLDWGIGHATRLIPIIENLIKNNHKVTIAGSGKSLELLKEQFPKCNAINFNGYDISYSKKLPLSIKMLFQIPKILKGIKREHKELEYIIEKNNIDIVLSDNRFGLWTNKAKCIYITHQLMVKMPTLLKIMEYPLYLFHKKYIKRYNKCWVPDINKTPNVAGDLTLKYKSPDNVKFIGPLTRFSADREINNEYNNDILIILSGPEPQRTVFENILINQISKTNYKTIIVRGYEDSNLEIPENIKYFSHLDTPQLQELIAASKYIICRSGYSTIMDLIKVKPKAILVPTPGQTEQEYLAKYYHKKEIFYSMKQKEFDLEIALENVKDFTNMLEISENEITSNYSELL